MKKVSYANVKMKFRQYFLREIKGANKNKIIMTKMKNTVNFLISDKGYNISLLLASNSIAKKSSEKNNCSSHFEIS